MKYIELNTFLNIKNIAQTGGQAKLIIKNEEIKVNGNIETQNKKKLFENDIVEFENEKYIVEKEVCLKS